VVGGEWLESEISDPLWLELSLDQAEQKIINRSYRQGYILVKTQEVLILTFFNLFLTISFNINFVL
jgi:hypothetical protein